MGKRSTRSMTPDLFSTAEVREPISVSENRAKGASSTDAGTATVSSSRYVLPKDLANAIKQLDDQELDRLLAGVLAEQKHRGRKPFLSAESSSKRRAEMAPVPMTTSKLNAVRAAFKAGVRPSQIARQFGLSQSDVRKALTGDRK